MNRARHFVFLTSVFGLLVVALAVGCNGSNDNPTSPPGSGRLSISMTDAPTGGVSEINVFVTGLTVKPKDGPEAKIANEIGLVDLLTLQNTTKQLVDLGVAAGDYEFVKIELDQSRSTVKETATGEMKPLQIASEEVKVLGGFNVPLGGSTDVLLDFKADQSIRHLGNGDWLLTPVISQVTP